MASSGAVADWPAGLFAELERGSATPLYAQLARRLESAIRDGSLPTGARLENEVALAGRLGLSRPTVRSAIQELVDRGLVVRRRGVGTLVVPGTVARALELTSLHEDLKDARRTPTTDLLACEVVPADDEVAARLGCPPGADVLHLRRRRSADGTPVAVLENHLPAEFADIAETELVDAGLYAILRERGVVIRMARQTIGARRATAEEAELLSLDGGAPVLTVTRVAFDGSGRAVEYGSHCYRPDLTGFHTTLVAK